MTDPAASPTVITALVGTVIALGTLIGWLVRQGRADVRDLIEAAAAERVAREKAAQEEREAEADRRDRRDGELNKVLGQISSKLAKLTQSDELIRAGLADLVNRLERLEERTDEHRSLPRGNT